MNAADRAIDYHKRWREAEADAEALAEALASIRLQATRKDRASDLKRYLVTDLEIIAEKADKALARNVYWKNYYQERENGQ